MTTATLVSIGNTKTSELAQRLSEFMETRNLTQAATGRAIGRSPAVINQYLQGTYAGDVASIDVLVENFLTRETEKQQTAKVEIPYVETTTTRKVREILRLAHVEGEINVVYGEAGLGKTLALRAYAKEYPDAILIEVDPGYTARVLLQVLAERLGLNNRGSIHDLSEAIVSKLHGSGRVLLVDEAELLPYRALEVLRRIHDKAEIGIVLAGMHRLLINLKGKKGELVQLYSRIGFAFNLGNALPKADVEAIAAQLLGNDTDLGETLYDACGGNTRRLSKLLRGVIRTSRINQQPVTARMIQEFSRMLIN